ncbi:MAG: hypothetical protein SGBAC_006748 [Bacillariaceae sp.]
MKFPLAILSVALALALHHASAFAPPMLRPQQLSVRSTSPPSLRMSEDEEPSAAAAPAAAPVVEDTPAPEEPAGALVAITQENIEFSAGVIGALLGLYIGGPFFAAIAAAAANLASKSEGSPVGTVSKSGIELYNSLLALNAKYSVLDKAGQAVGGAVDKLKASDSVDPETIAKVEDALAQTKTKITEVNDEYDLVGAGVTALGVVGDLVEKTAKTAGELNEQYELTSKAKDALDAGIEKAGVSESLEQATSFIDEKKEELTDKLSEVGLDKKE